MKSNKFSIKKRAQSFSYAFNGIRLLFLEEHNSRIHAVAAICAIIAGIILKILIFEWIALTFAIGFVFVVETINSSIENTADLISLEKSNKIKRIKDLSAAAVLISSLSALVIGGLIFIPKIVSLIKN
jgi:undecaprenol kinase/diacylglycerol kinase (ATP)